MDKVQGVKFKMYQSIEKVCSKYPTEVALIAAFKAEADEFVALIPEIRRVDGLIGNDHTVAATTKKEIKDTMLEMAFDVNKNIKAVSLKNNDTELKSLSSITFSALGAGKEEDVLQRCQRIATKAREILPALNERGMETDVLDELDDAIAEFTDKKPMPKDSRKAKSALILKLGNLFNQADDLMELMLLTLPNFKKSNPAFYDAFDKASITETPITRSTKSRFIPKDAVTSEKLTNFTVSIPAINFTTFINGESNPAFEMQNNKEVQIIISKEGYQAVTLDKKKIKRGQINTFAVKMQPVAA